MPNINNERKLAERLTVALSHDGLLAEEMAREAAFHVSDWFDDLRAFVQMVDDEQVDPKQAQRIVMQFLVHVPAHVAAAAKIVTDSPVTDVFEIGAVEGDGVVKREPGMKPWVD